MKLHPTMKMNTLKTHIKSIFCKLKVNKRGELIAKAGVLNARNLWGKRI